MTLYNIFYIDTTYGDPPSYEGTTDNFDKWLIEHNKDRVGDGNDPEKAHYFEVEECALSIFNKQEDAKMINALEILMLVAILVAMVWGFFNFE